MAKQLLEYADFTLFESPERFQVPQLMAQELVWYLNTELQHLYAPQAKPPEYRTDVISKGFLGIGRKEKRVKIYQPDERTWPEVVGADVRLYIAESEPEIAVEGTRAGEKTRVSVVEPGTGLMVLNQRDLAIQR